MIQIRRKKNGVQLVCQPCAKQVTVPVDKAQLFVCIEDDWHTVVFTCPSCKCARSQDLSQALAERLTQSELVPTPWSVQRHFSPQVTALGAFYTPRRVPRTWLPFDEVDVAHLVNDMNTCDWFKQLAAYHPHSN